MFAIIDTGEFPIKYLLSNFYVGPLELSSFVDFLYAREKTVSDVVLVFFRFLSLGDHQTPQGCASHTGSKCVVVQTIVFLLPEVYKNS